jgi:hypothetical protein
MRRDVRLAPGLMLRVSRTIGGWVWAAPGENAPRYFFRRTTTASHWRVTAQAGAFERDVTSIRQCAQAAYAHWQAWAEGQQQKALDKSAASA